MSLVLSHGVGLTLDGICAGLISIGVTDSFNWFALQLMTEAMELMLGIMSPKSLNMVLEAGCLEDPKNSEI